MRICKLIDFNPGIINLKTVSSVKKQTNIKKTPVSGSSVGINALLVTGSNRHFLQVTHHS